MSTSPILKIDQLAPNQSGKESLINDAVVALEAAANASYTVDLTTGTAVLEEGVFSRNVGFLVTGATADGNVVLPDGATRMFVLINSTPHVVTVEHGENSVPVPAETTAAFLAASTGLFVVAMPEEEEPIPSDMVLVGEGTLTEWHAALTQFIADAELALTGLNDTVSGPGGHGERIGDLEQTVSGTGGHEERITALEAADGGGGGGTSNYPTAVLVDMGGFASNTIDQQEFASSDLFVLTNADPTAEQANLTIDPGWTIAKVATIVNRTGLWMSVKRFGQDPFVRIRPDGAASIAHSPDTDGLKAISAQPAPVTDVQLSSPGIPANGQLLARHLVRGDSFINSSDEIHVRLKEPATADTTFDLRRGETGGLLASVTVLAGETSAIGSSTGSPNLMDGEAIDFWGPTVADATASFPLIFFRLHDEIEVPFV